MTRNKGQNVLTAAGIMLGLMAGCAGNGKPAPEWRPVATFGVAEDLPRVILYGDLTPHLPQALPKTPALDEFLYGPAPIPDDLLRNPQGLTLLGTRLLVCDQSYPGIISVDLASGASTGWNDSSHGPRCPVAVTAGGEPLRVYVADTTRRAVLVYDAQGRFVEGLAPGDEENQIFRPCSLLVQDRIVYIGDLGQHRVERWDIVDRQWLSPIVPPADGSGFLAPTGLAMTGENVLLIVDSIRGRVFRLSPEGNWLKPIGQPGRMEGQFVRPKQMGVTPSGLLFVADAGRQSVMIFTAEGDFLAEVRQVADQWRGFTLPTGVLTFPSDGMGPLLAAKEEVPEPLPDEWVIVSDSLNASSLTLMGVFLPHRTEAPTHAAE